MVSRKPPRSKSSRNGRPRSGSALRKNGVEEKSGTAVERARSRRRSKAAESEGAQERRETPVTSREPAAARPDAEPTTAGFKRAKETRRTGVARGAKGGRGKPQQAPGPDQASVDTRSSTSAASKRRRKAAPATPEVTPAPARRSPKAGTGAEPQTFSRTAAASGQSTAAAPPAPTAISPELGLGLAQALSAELAGLSQRLLESTASSAQQLASARSVPELVEIQARQMKALSEAWLEHTSRISEIYLAAVGPGVRS
jgi:Phasin protein